MMMRTVASATVALLGLLAGAAQSDEPTGITVVGTGEVLVRPNLLEIDLTASGSAELTGDAVVKYRDALKNITAAFDKLKLKNLKVVQGGLGIQTEGGAAGNMMAVAVAPGGDAAVAVKTKVDIARSMRLVLSGVDKLSEEELTGVVSRHKLSEEELTGVVSRLLDTAKDSGAAIGESQAGSILARMYGQQTSSSMVTFVVERADDLRQKAYQEAFKQAEERAGQLAVLARVELGPVLAVEETAADGGTGGDPASAQVAFVSAIYGLNSGSGKRETRVVSDRLADVPVRVALRVRFAIKERSGGK